MAFTRHATRRQALSQGLGQSEEQEEIREDVLQEQDSDGPSEQGGGDNQDTTYRMDKTSLAKVIEAMIPSSEEPQDTEELTRGTAGQSSSTVAPTPATRQDLIPTIRLPPRGRKGKEKATSVEDTLCSPIAEEEELEGEEPVEDHTRSPAQPEQITPPSTPPAARPQDSAKPRSRRHSAGSQTLGRRPRRYSEPKEVDQPNNPLMLTRADLEVILLNFQSVILEKVKELQRPSGE